MVTDLKKAYETQGKQLVADFEKNITLDNVNVSLQLVTEEHKKLMLDKIIAGDTKGVVEIWKEILSFGIDETKFIVDMQYYIRDILIDYIGFFYRGVLSPVALRNAMKISQVMAILRLSLTNRSKHFFNIKEINHGST